METEKDQGISPVPSPSPTLIGRAVYFSASGTGSDLDPGVIAFHVSGENSTMVGRVYRSDQDGSCHSDRTCFLVLICLPSLVFRPHHSVGDLSNIAVSSDENAKLQQEKENIYAQNSFAKKIGTTRNAMMLMKVEQQDACKGHSL
ncbi:hypothetical protein QCA50_018636 [Cerrena zonata]|uniref:Uncharacterized protein n=1 Tax=Cerrena zonata TaxID=2478898 RepID=A0AAW0FL08_9APHY